MRNNSYLWTSVKVSDITVSDITDYFVDRDFLTEFRRFGNVFCCWFFIWNFESPSYVYFQFLWPTERESIPHVSAMAVIISTKSEVIPPSIYRIRLRTSSIWLQLRLFSPTFYCICKRPGIAIGTTVRYLDPRFPHTLRNFRRFKGDFHKFLHYVFWKSAPYFYSRFAWPTDVVNIPHASTLTSIISAKFEVDMTSHCRVTAFLLPMCYMTWWPWPFDLEELYHVTNLTTKLEEWYVYSYLSWVITSSIGSDKIKMRMRLLGSKTITFLESPPTIYLFTIQLLWCTTTIKGRL